MHVTYTYLHNETQGTVDENGLRSPVLCGPKVMDKAHGQGRFEHVDGDAWGPIGGYPLVMTNIAVERSTIFNGKIHYFYGHFQ